IMLMALGIELPKQVFGHPWLLFNEEKMSKSKGNVVYAEDIVKLFGVDAARYYVLREMPFAADGNFTYDLIISRFNGDLANILGNLVSRTHAMTCKYFGGKVPAPAVTDPLDDELKAAALKAVCDAVEDMKTLHVADALDDIFSLLRRSNKYIDETTPWILAKSAETMPRLATVLYNLIECIRIAAALLQPFLPDTAVRIRAQFSFPEDTIENLTWGGVVPGTALGTAETLFARIDEKAKHAEIEAFYAAKNPTSEKEPEKPVIENLAQITIDDFAKVELRVARILTCEPVKRAKKLLKLTLDDGQDGRTIVSGIAPWYKPEDLIGRCIVVVANLKPAKLCGIESQGMLLAADTGEDEVKVVFVDGMPAGSRIH
ncbi:MAG: methionine--tRNA ligase subunit beta, partial [Clostridiales bacterium]|nr:methionine--tRNA ligase subunit beta [Clostridiales bacterium]